MSYLKENRGISKGGLNRIAKVLTGDMDDRFGLLEKARQYTDDSTILSELIYYLSDEEVTPKLEEIIGNYDLSSVASKKRAQELSSAVNDNRVGSVDEFTSAYLETALWSSMDESTPSGGSPFNENYSFEDFSREAIEATIEDCAKFQEENAELLERAYEGMGHSERNAGHDFWMTRNSYGSGFWDGDWDADWGGYYGDALTEAAKKFGEVYLYLGDDGLIYLS